LLEFECAHRCNEPTKSFIKRTHLRAPIPSLILKNAGAALRMADQGVTARR